MMVMVIVMVMMMMTTIELPWFDPVKNLTVPS